MIEQKRQYARKFLAEEVQNTLHFFTLQLRVYSDTTFTAHHHPQRLQKQKDEREQEWQRAAEVHATMTLFGNLSAVTSSAFLPY